MNYYEKIYNLIGEDVEAYFSEVISFYDNYHNMIIQYYTVSNYSYPKEAFLNYNKVLEDGILISDKMNNHKSYWKNVEYWDIFEKIESIILKLESIPSYPKFYKVTSIKSQNNSSVSEKYVLRQNETLEKVATNRDEDWTNIAINNNLAEEDYSLEGGVILNLKSNSPKASNLENIESIVDIAIGQNLLGKDLPENFSFDEDENDLSILTPQETFIESVNRLLILNKGQIPEFPTIGIQKDLIAESTKGEGFFFPIIVRQLSQNFTTDDTIASFEITDIEKEEDNLNIKTNVTNRLNDNFNLENILK